jgi:cyclophilin family peptidyl-prolyl cis-trans isomerase/HEAT repeat protein
VPTPVTAAELDTLGEILRLEDRREYDPVRFDRWARSSSSLVRRHAALGAGRIGERGAVPMLIRLMADQDSLVRADVAFALGELSDSSVLVVQALTAAARTANVDVGVEAVAALGRLAAFGAYASIEKILLDRSAPLKVKREALLAVWRFRRRSATLDLVLPYVTDSAQETRWRAVYALVRDETDPRAVPHLVQRLADSDPLVRALAARGLRAATVDSAGRRRDVTAALIRTLGDAHPHVRINAARSLATFRDNAHVAALAALLRDPDANVVLTAAEVLGELTLATADLQTFARDTTRPLVLRNTALSSLMRVEPSSATALARAWLNAHDWLQRLYAVRVLGAARGQTLRADLQRATADADARVAAAALQALAADTVNPGPPYALFFEKLTDRNAGIRAAALRGLQRRASTSDLEPFLQAYSQALGDTQRVARMAAVEALGELVKKDVPVARSFFLRFRKPSDPILHQRVANLFGPGVWGPVRPIETGKDAAFYRATARRFWHPDSAQAGPRVNIRTATGEIVLQLVPHSAPLTVLNFLSLVERKYFNRGRWHRVVPNFVLQDGDPRGDGSGGPGYAIRDEINRLRYERGTLGMALSGPDTGGSQFFITHAPQPHLDGGYTVFGFVTEGMDVADRVLQDEAILSIDVIR